MYEIKETDVRCMATIKAFQQYIKGILEKEAPLSEEWLLKRICHFFDRSKVTTKVERDFDYYMQDCEEIGIIRRNGFLYLPGDTYVLRGPMASGEIRDMNYIAYEELAAGIVVILEQNIRADRLSLYKVLCNQLGFRRTGPAAADRLDLALTCVSNMVDIDGDVLTIKS